MGLHTEVFHVAVNCINNPHRSASDSRHKNFCDNLQREAQFECKEFLKGLKVAI